MASDRQGGEAPGNARAYTALLDLVRLSSVGQSAHRQTIIDILQRVREHFRLPRAAVCVLHGGSCSAEYLLEDTGNYQVGDGLQLPGAWCQQIAKSNQTVMAANAADSDFETLPGCQAGAALAFAGARIAVDGQLYGVLNVTGDQALETSFDREDRHVLETAAALIGHHVSLQRSEARYELAVRGTGVGIWDWDVKTGEVVWSDQLRRLLTPGIDAPELSIERFGQRIHEDDRERVLALLDSHLAGEAEYRAEYRNRLPNGDIIWVHTRGQAVWNDKGEPIRMAGSCHDITERKQSEMRMQQQAEELLRTNRELEQFAAVASHDLQEPLRKITSFGALLSRDYADRLDDRGRMLIERMIDGAQRLRQLIQDLLDYSRSSNDVMRFEEMPLRHLMGEVCSDFELTIAETGAVIECDSDAVLIGDPLLLRQALQNLLSNSLKYRGDASPHIRISTERSADDGFWRLSFKDNGIGFSNRHATRVFEIFKRLHPRDEYPGTGIGLALCKRVVERHGGRISAESEPGKGTCIQVDWPVVPVPVLLPPVIGSEAASAGKL